MPRPYQNGLFSCCSPFSLCMKGWCCPCFVAGKNHHRIKYRTVDGYSSCNGWCMGWCGLTMCGGFGWVLQLIDRTEMREKYDLEGSTCGACCASWCCSCCETIQTEKELNSLLTAQNPASGYKAQPNMVADSKIGGPGGYPAAVQQPQSAYPANGYPQNGYPGHGHPQNGYPANGHPQNGYAANGNY